MKLAKPLPGSLVQRYQGWRATTFQDNKAWFQHLADEGQHPRLMVISCCDSRVNATQLFGADQGEFFMHRNIANLVPPFKPDGAHHGTSAAIEYAVTALKVAHIIILGHSSCGGVRGCFDMCSGGAPELEEKNSFVGRWMDILRPGYERIKKSDNEAEMVSALEKECILVSLENLMTFPFVKEALKSEHLSLHGVWNDIANGSLECYDAESGEFQAI